MAKEKKPKKAEKVAKISPQRKKEIDKIAAIDKKKEIQIKKDSDKSASRANLKYALIAIFIVIIAGAILIYATSMPTMSVVEKGDLVVIKYKGELTDGTVFDSGNFTTNAGMGQAIEGFDNAILGMHEGETKTFELTPEEAYGQPNPDLFTVVPLTQELNVTINTTIELFNLTFEEMPVIDKEYYIQGMDWPIKVTEIQDPYVILKQLAEDGEILYLEYGTSLIRVIGGKIRITLTPILGETVRTVVGDGKITDQNGTHMEIDFNHPLAGENLIFTVTILSVTPPQ